MPIAVLGIDLGKNSCSLVGLDASGAVIKRRRIRPENIPAFTKSMPACVVAMEACCGAHHLGRILAVQGHIVRLMSPEYVRPYVKAQKNDERDAEAIAQAASRPTMRFVELKREEQLDIQTLRPSGRRTHCADQPIARRSAGTRSDSGSGAQQLEQHLAAMLDAGADTTLSPRMRRLIEDMRAR